MNMGVAVQLAQAAELSAALLAKCGAVRLVGAVEKGAHTWI